MYLAKFKLFEDLFDEVYDNAYIVKSEGIISIKVELPGFRKENITLTRNGNKLALYADRKEGNAKVYMNSWEIPATTDVNKLTAKLEYGVLTINLPESEVKNEIKIEVT